jgi:hypothetical protein
MMMLTVEGRKTPLYLAVEEPFIALAHVERLRRGMMSAPVTAR